MTEDYTDDFVDADKFFEMVNAEFPYQVVADLEFIEKNKLIAEFGPARFHIRHFQSINIVHNMRPQYSKNTPVNERAYSDTGVWFYYTDQFYFKNNTDAVIFKLRFT